MGPGETGGFLRGGLHTAPGQCGEGSSGVSTDAPAAPRAVESEGGAGRLDTERSNRKYRLVGQRCGCRACETCGPVRGYDTREVLLERASEWEGPLLLTLTVDRKGTTTGRGFEGPAAAHEYVSAGGYVRRLMRLLGLRRWVWVLQFQSGTGAGWPHWHVLVDVGASGRLPVVDLKRAWRLWRDRWGIGGLDVEKSDFEGAEHAVRYITRYLVRQPEEGYPPWVLQSAKRVRLIGASKAVGRLTRGGTIGGGEIVGRPRVSGGALVDRLAACGATCVVLEERVDRGTGEVLWRYVETCGVTRGAVLQRVLADALAGVELVECRGERGRVWDEVVLSELGLGEIRRLAREDRDGGWVESCRRKRREDLLARWGDVQLARGIPSAGSPRTLRGSPPAGPWCEGTGRGVRGETEVRFPTDGAGRERC